MTSTDELENARAALPTADELRQRLRSCVLELVPNKWGLQGHLFRTIDHAPEAWLYALRDRLREILK